MEGSTSPSRSVDIRGLRAVPPLRIDVRLVRSKESKMFRIVDPRTSKFVELYELESLIAQAIDGTRSLDDLTDLARTYNPAVESHQVELLVAQLLEVGLLEEPVKPGHGKVIPLPVQHTAHDEFTSFRNEVVLDLEREEALKWLDEGSGGATRAPYFEAAPVAPNRSVSVVRGPAPAPTGFSPFDDDDDDLGGNTNLAVGQDPFKVLERSRAHMEANGETEGDTVLSSASPDSVVAPLPTAPQTSDDVEAPASPTVTPSAVASEQDEIFKQSKEKKRGWYRRPWVGVVLVLGVLVAVASQVPYPLRVTAEAAVTPTQRVYVRAQIGGILSEILVDEGATVHKGDVIARLDDRDLNAEKRKAVAQVEEIQAELERLHHGARPEEISQQRAVLAARSAAVQYAMKEAQRRAKMAAEGVGSTQAADEAAGDLQVKQNAASEAAAALRLLTAGTRPEEIAAREAALKRAKGELEFIDQKLADMVVIRAPIDGVVLTAKFRERLHERVEAGGLVCEIANMKTVRAEIYVPEREADTVGVGMPVTVKVESFPLHPFEGKVEFIAPAVEVRDKVTVVRVVATIDNTEGLLRQDMTGYGEVECGERSVLQLVTRRFLRWFRVRFLI